MPVSSERPPETNLSMHIAGLDKVFPQTEAQNRFRAAATERAAQFTQEAEVFLTQEQQSSLAAHDAFVTYLKSRLDVSSALAKTKNQYSQGAEPMVLSGELANFFGISAAVSDCIQGNLSSPEARPAVTTGLESIQARLQPIIDSKIMNLLKVQTWRAGMHTGVLNNRLGEAGDNLQRELSLRGGAGGYKTEDLTKAGELAAFTSKKIAEQKSIIEDHVAGIVQRWFEQVKLDYPQPDAAMLKKLQHIYDAVIRPLSDQSIALDSKLIDSLKRYIFPNDYLTTAKN